MFAGSRECLGREVVPGGCVAYRGLVHLPQSMNGRLLRCGVVAAGCLFFLGAAAPAPRTDGKGASKRQSAKPKRTIPQLIRAAMETGIEAKIESPSAENLKFSEEKPARLVRYLDESTTTKRENSFYVVIEKDAQGRGKPVALVWADLVIRKDAGKESSEGWSYRSRVDGTLEGAARMVEDGPAIDEKPVEIDESVRRRYEEEKRYFLIERAGQPHQR